ncbi:LysR family transcriptional regulator [Rhodovulum sp. YNF3179]|uniref:LysR family transcriptional regulator n=1 Tax=Rhodovulum sp. YNF3179 TaxID=3425127 RepID=UPI003D340CF3
MARINLEQLRSFLTVVRMGGISKASQALNLTQPAVTTRIRKLEQSLATDLFDRTGAGLRLTKRGEMLLKYAEQFEQLGELVARDVVDPGGTEGHLRLGVSETIAQCWLPAFISRLHQRYPKLEIEINVDISMNLRAGLLDREIDLAILLGPISEYSVDNIELPGFDLAWYCAADTRPDPAAPFTRPVITYARNTRPYRELKAELFRRVGPGIPLFPSTSLSACFRLVEAGLGVAALPRALGTAYVESGRIAEFDPGWHPAPLRFSASYMGEPRSHMLATAAETARQVAIDHEMHKNSL